MTQNNTGTVKWFDKKQGVGVITPDDGGRDLFVCQTDNVGDDISFLMHGQRVSFSIVQDINGPIVQGLRIEI